MTNADIRSIDMALAALRTERLRPKLAFRVAHTINQMMPTFAALGQQEERIRERHQEMEDGRPKFDEQGKPLFLNGHSRESLQIELRELFDLDAEVTLPKTRFRAADFEDSGVAVSPEVLLSLGELVSFDDEADPKKNGVLIVPDRIPIGRR